MPGTPNVLHPGVSGLPLSGNDLNDNWFLIEQSFLVVSPFIVSGLVPSAAAGLVVSVTGGVAVIGAQLTLATFNIAPIPPNTTSDLYLLQNGHGQALAQPSVAPANSVLLGTATAGPASVTSINTGRSSGRQQIVFPQGIVHGGSAAGLASAGQPRSVDLSKWNATAGEGFEVSGVLPPGAVSGMGSRNIVIKTANYTLVWGTDEVVFGDASGGAFTLTLPTAVGHDGDGFTIKRTNTNANVVHVATTGGQTIDLAASPHDLSSPMTSLDLLAKNSNWWLV